MKPKIPSWLICAFSLVLCLVLVSCRGRGWIKADGKITERHVLTWKSVDGSGYPESQRFFWNGEDIGMFREAIPKLKAMALGPGTVVKVVRRSEPPKWEFLLPSYDSGLVNDWILAGVHLEYYVQAKRLDVHTLTWWGYQDDNTRGGGTPEDARYIFDGRYIGKGEKAAEYLREIKIAEGAFVQILAPYKMYTSSPIGNGMFLSWITDVWKVSGARVEFLEENVERGRWAE